MRKIILLISATLFPKIVTKAQKIVSCIFLTSSNNDPAQYLVNNFENQQTKYIGQPLFKIFNDLELKILSHCPINFISAGAIVNNKRYKAGIELCFYDVDEFIKMIKEERKQMKFCTLIIYTKDLLLRSEYELLF